MFEKSWKKAFEQAEVSPSDNVWTNIELELEKARGAKLRRRLLFYQGLAAAAVFFALVIGIGVFVLDKDASRGDAQIAAELNQIRTKTNQTATEAASPGKQQSLSQDDQAALTDSSNPLTQQKNNTSTTVSGTTETANAKARAAGNDLLIEKTQPSKDQNLMALETAQGREQKETVSSSVVQRSVPAKEGQENEHAAPETTTGVNAIPAEQYLAFSEPKLPPLVEQRQPQLIIQKQEETIADPVALMLARLDAREKELGQEDRHEKKTNKNENVWTSLGFSAGSFNPAIARVSASPAAASDASFAMAYNAVNKSIANEQAKASGMAYTMGMNVGKKISDRWVMQGGINYLSQSSDYTARYGVTDQNLSKFRPPNINELANFAVSASSTSSDKLVATAPYNVNNNVRYLSVPVQAGYLVINRKLGWQVNAGVATDVFLQNTVTADVQNTDLGNGSSPYRQLNVSGLMGTELSYRFAGHYRIALNPGLRYPFGNIYKSESIRVNPLTFDIGLRLRYIFH